MELIKDKHGVLTVSPMPTADEVKAFYSKRYYQENLGQYQTNYSDDEVRFMHIKDRMFTHYLGDNFNGDYLDVGCGEGFSLKYFSALGAKCCGCDFSEAGIKSQNPAALENIDFEQCDVVNDDYFPDRKFDAISLNGILEHVLDAEFLLTKVKDMLRPGGLLYIQVPNEFNPYQQQWMNYNSKEMTEAPWFDAVQHVRYFSPDSLAQMVESIGYERVDILGDFPVDMFLTVPETDYYAGTFGKTAHKIRVETSNLISEDIVRYIKYCRASIEIGLGRSIHAIYKMA